eukprot:COSAG05_NODE_6575_length_936_cov_1.303465_2_plen_107_part_00
MQQFQDAIRIDAAAREDRIVLLFCESAGWQFGCDEHALAPVEVKACIDKHEAIAYRPKDPTGPSCHEFPAMVRQLLTKVGATGVGVFSSILHSMYSRMGSFQVTKK